MIWPDWPRQGRRLPERHWEATAAEQAVLMGNVKAGTVSNGAGFDVGVAMIFGNLYRSLSAWIHVMFQIAISRISFQLLPISETTVGSKPQCIMHWAQRGSLPTP